MKKKLFLVACLVLVLCVSLLLPLTVASADYQDIVDDQNAIVNFNQYIQNTYINSFTYPNSATYVTDYILNTSHQYYIKINTSISGGNHSLETQLNSQTYSNILSLPIGNNIVTDIVYTPTLNNSRIYVYVRNSNNAYTIVSNGFMCIDLTQMFGSGNEPTLSQCQDLFVSDYYAYNIGAPVSLSGLDSYAQGYISAYDNMNVKFSGNILYSNVYGVTGTFYNTGNTGIGATKDSSLGYSIFGFNFPATLNSGDTINIEFDMVDINNSLSSNLLQIGYFDNGVFVSIANFNSNNMSYNSSYSLDGVTHYTYVNGSVSFSVPKELNAIYFKNNNNYSYIGLRINAHSTNFAFALDQAYRDGVEKGSNAYQVGNNGYNAIYEAGRQQGINDAGEYTFLGLISAVVDTPINAVLNMLDFNLLGVNMKAFYLSLFTFCIIVFIVKLII